MAFYSQAAVECTQKQYSTGMYVLDQCLAIMRTNDERSTIFMPRLQLHDNVTYMRKQYY